MGLVTLFVMPALWVFWIFIAYFRTIESRLSTLLLQWLGIDFFMLALLLYDPSWTGQSGAEIVLMIWMAPLLFPTIILLHNLHLVEIILNNFQALLEPLNNRSFTEWVIWSLLILPQSLIIVGISELLVRRRIRKSKAIGQITNAAQ